MVNPYDIIAEHFWDLLEDCLENGHIHYWLKRWTWKYEVEFYWNCDSFNDDVRCTKWGVFKCSGYEKSW